MAKPTSRAGKQSLKELGAIKYRVIRHYPLPPVDKTHAKPPEPQPSPSSRSASSGFGSGCLNSSHLPDKHSSKADPPGVPRGADQMSVHSSGHRSGIVPPFQEQFGGR